LLGHALQEAAGQFGASAGGQQQGNQGAHFIFFLPSHLFYSATCCGQPSCANFPVEKSFQFIESPTFHLSHEA
jgi:hypothetical protein